MHRAPGRPQIEGQKVVVHVEADKGGRRIVGHLSHGAGPDGGGLGQQMGVPEQGPVAATRQIGVQGLACPFQLRQITRRLFLEPQEIADHPPEPWAGVVALLGKQGTDPLAAVFKGSVIDRYGKGHHGRLGRDVQMREQGGQIGIVGLIVNDEAGVDGHRLVRRRGVDRAGVTAEAVVGLEQGDVMRL